MKAACLSIVSFVMLLIGGIWYGCTGAAERIVAEAGTMLDTIVFGAVPMLLILNVYICATALRRCNLRKLADYVFGGGILILLLVGQLWWLVM